MAKSQLEMTVLTDPTMVNFGGHVHGGAILKMMDNVAYTCAARYAGGPTVTLSVDQVIFKEPVYVGELLTFQASVNYTGRTSMEVGIKVTAENIHDRSVRHTNSSYFTMVALTKEGKPTPVKELVPQDTVQKHRHAAAQKRRDFRLEIQKRNEEIKGTE